MREMVLLSIFFTHESDPRRIISRLFFIHFVAPCLALHLAVKILLQIFLYEDLKRINSIRRVSCISLGNASRTAYCNQYY